MIFNSWQNAKIDINLNRTGEQNLTCPKCDEQRSQQGKKPLSANTDTNLFNCHHCGYSGKIDPNYKHITKREDFNPLPPSSDKEKLYAFFAKRGISSQIVDKYGITTVQRSHFSPQLIAFNHFVNNENVCQTLRSIDKKEFSQAKGNNQILFGLDLINYHQNFCIITEGHIDCLSLAQAGIDNALSVPAGGTVTDKPNLNYIDNSLQYINRLQCYYLATDNDAVGISLQKQLLEKLGRNKCKIVAYPKDCKDLNDVLKLHGAQAVKDAISNALQPPLTWIVNPTDLFNYAKELITLGFPEGAKTGINAIDELLTFYPKHLNGFIGTPGSGKSEILNCFGIGLARTAQWKTIYISPEHSSKMMINRLMRNILRHEIVPPFAIKDNKFDERIEYAQNFIVKYIGISELTFSERTIDKLADRIKEATQFGYNNIVIDPFTKIDISDPKAKSKTDEIERALSKLCDIASENNICINLGIHTNKETGKKTGKDEEKFSLYDANGSAAFNSSCDNGGVFYRPDRTNNAVEMHITKIKEQPYAGKIGTAFMKFENFWYTSDNDPEILYENVSNSKLNSSNLRYQKNEDENDVPF